MVTNELVEKNMQILEKLANGINPIDDSILPADSIINNVEISRALFFALSELNSAKNSTSTKTAKKNFYVDPKLLENFEFVEEGTYLTKIVEQLNTFVDTNTTRRLSRAKMVRWLIEIGILEAVHMPDAKQKRHMPTQAGLDMGLQIVELVDRFGYPFKAVKYPVSMQKFIIDNIEGLYGWNSDRNRQR